MQKSVDATPATEGSAAWRPLDIDCGELDPGTGSLVMAREGIRGQVRELSSISNLRAGWAVLRQWLIIGAVIAAAVLSHHWALYVLAFVVVASRQHALGVLMHDASHYRLFSNRAANEWVGDLLLALPIFLSLNRYRVEHLQHHRYTNTDRDPYWNDFQSDPVWHWPKTPRAAAWIFVRDLLGLNIPSVGKVGRRWSPFAEHFTSTGALTPLRTEDRIRTYIFIGALLTGLAVTNGWLPFLLLWLLPALTLGFAFIRMRTVGEHLGLPGRHELDSTRHIDGTWLERLTICPLNINYHIAHHMFPSVPYYRLPELQRLLLKDPIYRDRAYLKRSYLGMKDGTLGEVLVRS